MALFCGGPVDADGSSSWVEDRDMGDVKPRPAGVIITFPDPASRPNRNGLRADEPRGEILLFTGVRYEWQSEPTPAPSAPRLPGGTASRTGRRRRRP